MLRLVCASTSIWTTTAGLLVFEHACRLGLEGIISKRRDSRKGTPFKVEQ
jgi:ATP-dependent DNA ligase